MKPLWVFVAAFLVMFAASQGAVAGPSRIALAASAPSDPVPPPAPNPPEPQPQPDPPRVDCRVKRCVALTFDDGPSVHTRTLLRTLRQRNARATFFVLGHRARRDPATVRTAFADGHQIGTHTWDHPDLRRLPFGAVDRQIGGSQREVWRITGKRPRVFRPPYGATGVNVVRSTRKRGLPQVMWDVDPRDWEHRDSRRIAHHVVTHARRNSIVLLHDIHPTTVRAVPEMIRRLRGRGFVLVTVSEVFPEMTGGQFYPPSARTWWRPTRA